MFLKKHNPKISIFNNDNSSNIGETNFTITSNLFYTKHKHVEFA